MSNGFAAVFPSAKVVRLQNANRRSTFWVESHRCHWRWSMSPGAFYSARSASTGFTDAARRAGI
jgi:hypothetical protein